MILNVVLGAAIFAFAIWSIVRSIRLNKQGKCAGCAKQSSCAAACDSKEV